MMGLTSSEDSQCSLTPSPASFTSSSPAIFYGVWQPPNSPTTSAASNQEGVFTDQKQALQIVKNNREARFKAFKSFKEASQFSKLTPTQIRTLHENGNSSLSREVDNISGMVSVGQAALIEKGSAFRAPKTQDLIKFRKAIQVGDIAYVKQMIWANPRYLVSSGDSPTILHEGARFNSLHVACNTNQPAMCNLILETIEDSNFMHLLYSDDSEHTRVQRINNLVDLYLNMPDKASCETPLHFAAKYGCTEIVKMLVTHPVCDIRLKNKYDKCARDVICSRCRISNKDEKMEIERLFEDQYFVPVLASEDNASQPYVGKPYSPLKKDLITPQSFGELSPLQTSYTVRAYAGPMSVSRANEIYRRWKKPSVKCSTPCMNYKHLLEIRLTDSDKGLERIGRELAKELNVPWAEKWPFLNAYCDLSKREGLSKLETHLRNMDSELGKEVTNFYLQELYTWQLPEIAKKCTTSSNAQSTTKDVSSSAESGPDFMLHQAPNCSTLDGLCEVFRNLNINSSAELDQSKVGENLEVFPNYAFDVTMAQSSCQKIRMCCTPPSLQELTSQHVLNHICSDVARNVACKLHERMMAGGRRRSGKDFAEHLQPSIECLIRVAHHHFRVNQDETDLKRLHFNISHLVRSHLEEDYLITDFQHWLNSSSSGSLTSTSDDDYHGKEVLCWRQCQTKNDTVASTVLQHVRCILDHLKTGIASDTELVSKSCDCCCDWTPKSFVEFSVSSSESDALNLAKVGGGESAHESRRRRTSGPACIPSTEGYYCRVDAHRKSEERPSSVGDDRLVIDPEVGTLSDDSASDVFFTPLHSSQSSLGSSMNDVHTPDEGIPVFMNGCEPTKLDVDIMRALEDVRVDPVIYPHVHRWLMLMSTFSKEEVERWASPFVRRKPQIRQTPESGNWATSPSNMPVSGSSYLLEMQNWEETCQRPSLQNNELSESLWTSREQHSPRFLTSNCHSLNQDSLRRKIF